MVIVERGDLLGRSAGLFSDDFVMRLRCSAQVSKKRLHDRNDE